MAKTSGQQGLRKLLAKVVRRLSTPPPNLDLSAIWHKLKERGSN
jgi:hypothetical protein